MNLREHIRKILKEEITSTDTKTIQSELIDMLGKSNTDNGDRIEFVNKEFGSDSSFDIIVDNLDQEILDKINEFMDKKGWFPANIGFSGMKGRIYSQNVNDYLGEDDVQISYEAHSPDAIKVTQTKAYHVTPDIFFNKINQEGLIPKSESKLSNHPDRVYLYRNQDKDKDIVWALWNSLSKEKQEQIKNYYVLEIDLTQIPNHEFFKDPQAMADYGAIYTDKPIPKSAIKVIAKIDTKDIETVDKEEMSKEEEKIASDELKQKEKERLDREKEREKSDSEYAEYSKKLDDLPDNLKDMDINDLLSLEEQIKKVVKKVIKEETQISPQVLRRRYLIDEMFEHIRGRYTRLFCEYRNPNILLGVLYERTLSDLYHAWFYQTVSDDDWDAASEYIQKYLKDKYEKETIDLWEERCNNKDSLREEELTEKCWKGYTQKGMKTMFGKRYPNCVKKKK